MQCFYPLRSILVATPAVRPSRQGAARRTLKNSLSRRGWERCNERAFPRMNDHSLYSRFKTFIPYIAKSMSTTSEVAVLQVSREDISQRGELKKIFSKMFNFMLKSPWFAPTWSHPCLFDPECTPDASGNCTPYHRQLSRASKSIGRTTPMLMVPSPTSLLSAEFLETPLKGQAWQEEETNTLIGAG